MVSVAKSEGEADGGAARFPRLGLRMGPADYFFGQISFAVAALAG